MATREPWAPNGQYEITEAEAAVHEAPPVRPVLDEAAPGEAAPDEAPAADPHPWFTTLTRRWPSGLAIILAGLTLMDGTANRALVSLIVVVMAVAYPLIGAGRRQLDRPGVLALEVGGILIFGAFVVAALTVDPVAARYLLAAAFLNHAGWDLAHHLADRVVPRPYAECCAVFDAILGVALLVLP